MEKLKSNWYSLIYYLVKIRKHHLFWNNQLKWDGGLILQDSDAIKL